MEKLDLSLTSNGQYTEKQLIYLRCKKDHLSTSGLQLIKQKSCYVANFSPAKHPHKTQSFTNEIKEVNSSDSFHLGLPKISEHSNYNKSYRKTQLETIEKGKAKQSYFVKMPWVLDVNSIYKKNYAQKENEIKDIKLSKNIPNNLIIFQLKESKRQSNYQRDYTKKVIVQDKSFLENNRDHLNSKQNIGSFDFREDRKKYDSSIDVAKQKLNKISSIFAKEPIKRFPLK